MNNPIRFALIITGLCVIAIAGWHLWDLAESYKPPNKDNVTVIETNDQFCELICGLRGDEKARGYFCYDCNQYDKFPDHEITKHITGDAYCDSLHELWVDRYRCAQDRYKNNSLNE